MDNILRDAFDEHGSRLGMRIDAEYSPFKEFKTSWKRCGDLAEVSVTDYMKRADTEVKSDLANSIVQRLQGHGNDIFTPTLVNYLRSDEFLQRNQPLYLKRSRNLKRSSRGRVYDLQELYEELLSEGHVCEVPYINFTWTTKPNYKRVGYTSVVFRVVAVSSALDSEDMPRDVAKFVLFHELLHHEQEIMTKDNHDADFRMREMSYPGFWECQRRLIQFYTASKNMRRM